MPTPTTFSGEITVSSRIVDYLSSGLYESPAACLKELINNSYDADAKRVNLFVKPDANRIIIEDDGIGMSKDEFEKHFKRISESHKRDDSSVTDSGRPKIGKIGIGFIAANEICDTMEIFSTKSGSTELLHVSINFSMMRLDIQERRRKGDDVAKADYVGDVQETDLKSHYTRIFLKEIRGEAREILASARKRNRSEASRTLYGLSLESTIKQLSDPHLRSWSDFDSYSYNLLQVALNVPVKYQTGWIPTKYIPQVKQFEERTSQLGFSVYYDGSEIRKPTILCASDDKRALVEKFNFKGKHVAAQGYFFARHGALWPQDLNGVLLRIRHAAVGGYDSSFLGFPSSEGTLFQKWISTEVWADDRLEEAMNIDRKTLRIAHPAYVELQGALHKQLSQFIKQVRSQIYDTSRTAEASRKAQETAHTLRDFASKTIAPLSQVAAKEMARSWEQVASDASLRKRLVKRFSVEELYRVVLEVAKDVLPPSLLAKFIRQLTKRLTE